MTTSLREIRASKLRSFLTIVGICIGVTTVVSSIGVVEGSFAAWRSYIESYGGLERVVLTIQPLPLWQKARSAQQQGVRSNDVVLLRDALKHEGILSPEINMGASKITTGSHDYNALASGVDENYITINHIQVYAGRAITALDNTRTAAVAVIGAEAAEALFGTTKNILGRQVELRNIKFTIVGVCGPRNLAAGRGWDVAEKGRVFLVPLTVVQKSFGWGNWLTGVNIEMNSRDHVEENAARIERLIRFYHNGLQDIAVHTKTQELQNWRRTEQGAKFALAMIASISLLVAGIGIMNVMFASINERTREIGTRRALGASQVHIGVQFLTEAVVIAVIGGVAGVALGEGLIPLLGRVMPDEIPGKPILVISSVWLGIGFSVLVGLLAGMIPALRAVRLDPLDALRRD